MRLSTDRTDDQCPQTGANSCRIHGSQSFSRTRRQKACVGLCVHAPGTVHFASQKLELKAADSMCGTGMDLWGHGRPQSGSPPSAAAARVFGSCQGLLSSAPTAQRSNSTGWWRLEPLRCHFGTKRRRGGKRSKESACACGVAVPQRRARFAGLAQPPLPFSFTTERVGMARDGGGQRFQGWDQQRDPRICSQRAACFAHVLTGGWAGRGFEKGMAQRHCRNPELHGCRSFDGSGGLPLSGAVRGRGQSRHSCGLEKCRGCYSQATRAPPLHYLARALDPHPLPLLALPRARHAVRLQGV